mmetsp:Transcript_37229/g.99083  ORF Transcript_37229/g.99083 Transcript_37229/m.99083 type:complete len:207 (+) Transcript_37229:586-1206(+)
MESQAALRPTHYRVPLRPALRLRRQVWVPVRLVRKNGVFPARGPDHAENTVDQRRGEARAAWQRRCEPAAEGVRQVLLRDVDRRRVGQNVRDRFRAAVCFVRALHGASGGSCKARPGALLPMLHAGWPRRLLLLRGASLRPVPGERVPVLVCQGERALAPRQHGDRGGCGRGRGGRSHRDPGVPQAHYPRPLVGCGGGEPPEARCA